MVVNRVAPKHSIRVVPPKKKAFVIETPDGIPKLHQLLFCCAMRGGGKSVMVSSLVARLIKEKLITAAILVSPTYASNKEIFSQLNLQEGDVYEPTKDVVRTLMARLDAELQEWKVFDDQRRKYKAFRRLMDTDTAVNNIPSSVLLDAMQGGFFDSPPHYKYGDLNHPPRFYVIFDDCLGSDCFRLRSSGIINLAIRHRHVMEGNGVSLAFLCQSYAAHDGLSRILRENSTCLCLWKNRQEQQMQKIIEENLSTSDMTEDRFHELCEHCWSIPHGFLVIDHSVSDPSKTFRCCWDEYLT